MHIDREGNSTRWLDNCAVNSSIIVFALWRSTYHDKTRGAREAKFCKLHRALINNGTDIYPKDKPFYPLFLQLAKVSAKQWAFIYIPVSFAICLWRAWVADVLLKCQTVFVNFWDSCAIWKRIQPTFSCVGPTFLIVANNNGQTALDYCNILHLASPTGFELAWFLSMASPAGHPTSYRSLRKRLMQIVGCLPGTRASNFCHLFTGDASFDIVYIKMPLYRYIFCSSLTPTPFIYNTRDATGINYVRVFGQRCTL